MTRRTLPLVAIFVFAMLFADRAPPAPTAAAGPSTRPAVAAAAGATATATPAEFGQRLEASVARGDPSVLTAAFDEAAVIDKGLEGLDAPPDIRRQALAVGLSRSFGQTIANLVRQGASYRLLHIHDVGGEPRALFRLYGSQGLNYHDYHLAPAGPGGALRIADVDIYITGEPISQTFRRSALPAVASEKRGRIGKLLAGESAYVTHVGEIAQFHQAIRERRYADALRVYDALPEEVKKDKTLMLARLGAVRNADPAKYLAALEEYRKQFPDDPGGLLTSIDAMFLRGEYDHVLAAIDQIDKKVGGDLFLDFYRANVAVKRNDLPTANRLLDRVIAAEPTIKMPYFGRVELALKARDYATVASVLAAAEPNAGVQWGSFDRVPAFAEFMKSPEYAAWSKQHPARPAGATNPATRPSARTG